MSDSDAFAVIAIYIFLGLPLLIMAAFTGYCFWNSFGTEKAIYCLSTVLAVHGFYNFLRSQLVDQMREKLSRIIGAELTRDNSRNFPKGALEIDREVLLSAYNGDNQSQLGLQKQIEILRKSSPKGDIFYSASTTEDKYFFWVEE